MTNNLYAVPSYYSYQRITHTQPQPIPRIRLSAFSPAYGGTKHGEATQARAGVPSVRRRVLGTKTIPGPHRLVCFIQEYKQPYTTAYLPRIGRPVEMPGRRPPVQPVDKNLCRRCQTVEPSIVVRTDALCKDCFSKYVQTKVVKRMEAFRVRNAEFGKARKLLLPLSYDACSVGLLHVLSQHLKGQTKNTGRTGYQLCILHIYDQLAADGQRDDSFAALQARYPQHEYHSAALSEVLSLDDLSNLFPDAAEHSDGGASPRDRLLSILNSSKSATGRQDTLQILRRKLVVQVAKRQQCEAVLCADSTTKLAERTLSETVKGRGSALPWIVADGESLHGAAFYYPQSEILTKELEAYVSFIEPPLDQLIVKADKPASVSTKNMTIDDLMHQYFESVERDFPSIVANVVRTTGKLQSPSLSQVEQQCELCNIPLQGQSPEKSRLCYGCIRNMPQITS